MSDGERQCPFLFFATCKKELCELWHENQEMCLFTLIEDRLKDCRTLLNDIKTNTTP